MCQKQCQAIFTIGHLSVTVPSPLSAPYQMVLFSVPRACWDTVMAVIKFGKPDAWRS